jgi:hypothetical protein
LYFGLEQNFSTPAEASVAERQRLVEERRQKIDEFFMSLGIPQVHIGESILENERHLISGSGPDCEVKDPLASSLIFATAEQLETLNIGDDLSESETENVGVEGSAKGVLTPTSGAKRIEEIEEKIRIAQSRFRK